MQSADKAGRPGQEPPREGSELLISYLTLRRLIGLLGLALPSILILVHAVVVRREVLPSLSAYYYSELNPLFVGILCTTAAFLLSYKGHELSDHVASVIAGVGCLGVALLPCGRPDGVATGPVSLWLADLELGTPHYLCAAAFLASLAYISLFEFTKTAVPGQETRRKRQRNKVYRAMGWIMVVCLLVMGANGIYFWVTHKSLLPYAGVLVGETISIVAFAFSWLTKGEFILKD
jgi:hypothetical protein